mmetsp:Transcript_6274/g.17749  ORF Transcript_6274/g.17749 Transcript_6274/m.17749 type:complete len:282 (-) Transcript_6274:184-1029(-)
MTPKFRLPEALAMNCFTTPAASLSSASGDVGPWSIGVSLRPSSSYRRPPCSTKQMKCSSTLASSAGGAVLPSLAASACTSSKSGAPAGGCSRNPARSCGLMAPVASRKRCRKLPSSIWRRLRLLASACSTAMVPHALAMVCLVYHSSGAEGRPSAATRAASSSRATTSSAPCSSTACSSTSSSRSGPMGPSTAATICAWAPVADSTATQGMRETCSWAPRRKACEARTSPPHTTKCSFTKSATPASHSVPRQNPSASWCSHECRYTSRNLNSALALRSASL